MTVADLRKALENVPDHLPVHVCSEDLVTNQSVDYMRHAVKAQHQPQCSIASEDFVIYADKPFGW